MEKNNKTTIEGNNLTKTPPKFIEREYLQRLIDCGLNVLPCKDDKSPAIARWTNLKEQLFDLTNNHTNFEKVGIICGKISKNITCIDVDTKNDPGGVITKTYFDNLEAALGDTFDRLVTVETVSGGFHILFRCKEKMESNQKLAMLAGKVVIETRGEGGYFIAAPSAGYTLKQNNYFMVPTITESEYNIIMNIARDLSDTDQKPKEYKTPAKSNIENKYIESPFEAFDQKNSILDVLTGAGWSFEFESPKGIHVRRPGKERGSSGIIYKDEKFKCFSTSTNFETDRQYKAYQIYTFLNHNGDFKASAKEMISRGYGKPKAQRINNLDKQNINKVVSAGKEAGKSFEEIESEALKLTTNKEGGSDYVSVVYNNPDLYLTGADLMKRFVTEKQIYFNDITKTLMIGDRVIPEPEQNAYYFDLVKIDLKLKLPIWKHFLRSTGSNCIEIKNPLLDFFKTPNKTTGNIDRLYDCLNAPEDMRSIFKKWYCGIVRSIVDNKANIMYLLLVGIIRTGKTEFLKRLLPPELKMYTNMEPITDHKDFTIRMSKMILIINDETHLLSKNEAALFRQVIGVENLALRRVYGHDDEYIPRLATLCGTSNDTEIIKDPANNRRIIPIELPAPYNFNLYNSIDKSEALREAYYLYMNGFECDLTGEEVAAIQSKKEYEEINDFGEIIDSYIKPSDEYKTLAEIIFKLQPYTKKVITGSVLGKELQRAGYIQERVYNKRNKKSPTCYKCEVLNYEDSPAKEDEILPY